ncbi:MAG TPA: hypothetical protein VLI90_03105 [Tepidisphaeraceae bacterium]|nr:hypothetical protein [Tepidisphaeraceae bacterium]
MGLIPDTKIGKIEFCESHVSPFTTNAVAIGTTAPAVTAWSALVTAARAAYTAQQAAQLAAKNATTNLNVAVGAMMDATSSIIKQVRAKADLSGNGVYALASLPVPATPTPVGPPGTPTNFTVSLDQTGVLKLKWKCANPAGGTIYQVWRRTTPTGEFAYLGGSGTKDFVDATIPAGSSQVTYQIQGVRSTAVGEWAQFNVNFGVGSGGAFATIASVEETTPTAKLAA